jgi:hypothetical protein
LAAPGESTVLVLDRLAELQYKGWLATKTSAACSRPLKIGDGAEVGDLEWPQAQGSGTRFCQWPHAIVLASPPCGTRRVLAHVRVICETIRQSYNRAKSDLRYHQAPRLYDCTGSIPAGTHYELEKVQLQASSSSLAVRVDAFSGYSLTSRCVRARLSSLECAALPQS